MDAAEGYIYIYIGQFKLMHSAKFKHDYDNITLEHCTSPIYASMPLCSLMSHFFQFPLHHSLTHTWGGGGGKERENLLTKSLELRLVYLKRSDMHFKCVK